jgi:hypothetical protein
MVVVVVVVVVAIAVVVVAAVVVGVAAAAKGCTMEVASGTHPNPPQRRPTHRKWHVSVASPIPQSVALKLGLATFPLLAVRWVPNAAMAEVGASLLRRARV